MSISWPLQSYDELSASPGRQDARRSLRAALLARLGFESHFSAAITLRANLKPTAYSGDMTLERSLRSNF